MNPIQMSSQPLLWLENCSKEGNQSLKLDPWLGCSFHRTDRGVLSIEDQRNPACQSNLGFTYSYWKARPNFSKVILSSDCLLGSELTLQLWERSLRLSSRYKASALYIMYEMRASLPPTSFLRSDWDWRPRLHIETREGKGKLKRELRRRCP